jgi:MATE family multidrug resistance protein
MLRSVSQLKKLVNGDKDGVIELFLLATPLMLTLSSGCFCLFFDTLFLAQFSTEALQLHTLTYALVALFQSTCIRMASESQVLVSQSIGEKKNKQVGVFLWQMIYLSLLSMGLTLPLSALTAKIYFTPEQSQASEFFSLMMAGNFLFPLAAALNGFYSGRGQIKPLLYANVCLIASHMPITYFAINAFGLKGAAIAQLLTQALYCICLFTMILQPKHRNQFGTSNISFCPKSFIASTKIGALNGASAALIALSWTVTVKIAAFRGSELMTIIAFGNGCILFGSFVNLGLGQAVSIKTAYFIGAGEFQRLKKLITSCQYAVCYILLLLFFPLVLYPHFLLQCFFPNYLETMPFEKIETLRLVCKTLWFFEFFTYLDRICRGLLTAMGDTIYMFLSYILTLTLGNCLPVYLFVVVFPIKVSSFWVLMAITLFLRSIPLLYRLSKKNWHKEPAILAGTN